MKPIAIGGGTYARALKCGVAFGPEEEGEENVIHQPDEYITFEKIEKCLKILLGWFLFLFIYGKIIDYILEEPFRF